MTSRVIYLGFGLSFLSCIISGHFVHAQTSIRLNHTLPQYKNFYGSNDMGKNFEKKNSIFSFKNSLNGRLEDDYLRSIIIDGNVEVSSAYGDNTNATLKQIARMADEALLQIDIGTTVAPLDSHNMMSSPVSGDVSSATYQIELSKVSRKISDKLNEKISLSDFGAKLDNSYADEQIIQKAYNALHDGDVVEVPQSSQWQGYIQNPDPNKHITWLFNRGVPGAWSPPPGDGDVTISHNNGVEIQRRDFNTKSFAFPAQFFYWNDDSNYCGPYCKNWSQNSAAYFRAISGPTSTGNTSPIYATLDSYGQNPSGSYDVGITVGVTKYGQNSTWGIVDETNDFSGKSPGAFASWNEYDVWANGQDVKAWDKTYGKPQAGHRSVFFVNAGHFTPKPWSPNMQVYASFTKKGDLPKPDIINVQSEDHAYYIWYPSKSGKTGVKKPFFPTPARLNATLKDGVLNVSRVFSGKVNIGDYITGATPVDPVKIIRQISGDIQGVGIYVVDDKKLFTDTADAPVYSAPRVEDGSVVWQFGEELRSSVSSVLFFTGQDGDAVDTMVGVDKNIIVGNAMVDSSLARFQANTASLRMAPGQPIDFSGNGTLAGANRHTLDYDNGALRYKVDGVNVLSIKDNGSIISNLPTQLPIMTKAQIRAYPTPVIGMEIYDKEDDGPVVYTKKGWQKLVLSPMN